MRRQSPAQFSGELFGLLQYLDQEERGQMGYPAARQGGITQSIASASFVQATQGQLTSIVREMQRLLTGAQEDAVKVAFQMDEHFLDFEKSLVTVVGKKKSYTPSKDIAGAHGILVEYGAGAGLDRLNTDQRLLNFYSAGMLSAETALNQTDFVTDGRNEMRRREDEEISRMLLQKFLGDPTITSDIIGRVQKYKKDKGVSLADAWAEVQGQLAEEAQAAAEVQQTAQPVPGAEGEAGQAQPTAPGEPGTESVESLTKGLRFAPPPMQEAII